MAKYLIQDIIPPGKKHRAAKGGVHKAAKDTKNGIHDVVSHFEDASGRTAPHEEIVVEANQLMHGKPKEITLENPRMILEEHIHGDSVEKTASIDEKPTPTTAVNTIFDGTKTEKDVPHFPEYAQNHRIFENSGNKWVPWVIGTGIVVGIVVILLNFFGGATITIVPKHDTIPLDQQMTALKNPQTDELPYAVMKVTLSETAEVPATGTKMVTEKASGQIVVYNQQMTAQRLIRNTRFESPSGKIYRINESINVPKATIKNTKVIPGSVTVTVYADEAGPDYNSEPVDFTVPGLKGTPQYDKVYARSKSAISGGEAGTLKTVSDKDMKSVTDELRIALETKLRTKARADLSPTQVSYDKGLLVELKEATLSKEKASSEDKALVVEEGSIYLVVFDRVHLTNAIEKALIPAYKGEEVTIKNLDALTFSMPSQNGESLWNQDKLTFSLKGTPELTWKVDENMIVQDIVGAPKQGFNEILAKYSTIERAKATLRPFWKSNFPKDPSKIMIKIVESIDENDKEITKNTP